MANQRKSLNPNRRSRRMIKHECIIGDLVAPEDLLVNPNREKWRSRR
jgi:hypothetical protein